MNNMTAAQAAQQANRDNGGKYATKEHAEVDAVLTPEDPLAGAREAHSEAVRAGATDLSFDEFYEKGDDLRFLYGEAAEQVEDLSADEVVVLRRMLASDAIYNGDPEYFFEELSEFEAYWDAGESNQYQRVGNMVAEWYTPEDSTQITGRMRIDVPGPTMDGDTPYYSVGVNLGEAAGYLNLTMEEDQKYLAGGDRERGGLKAAVAAAEVIEGNTLMVRRQAAKLGLIPEEDVAKRRF